MECHISTDLLDSLKTIIRFQNTILLKEICRDNNWDYNSLKKKYIKDKVIKEEIMPSIQIEEAIVIGKKKIKIKKSKVKIQTKTKENEEVKEKVNAEAVNQVEEQTFAHNIQSKKQEKPKKKRIKKKKENSGEIECKVIKYKSKIYYINNEENAYDIDGNFCGILEDNGKINFEAEEVE